MTKPKGRDKTNRRAYQSAQHRSEAPGIHGFTRAVSRAGAAYDPLRDGPLLYVDPAAELFGDPLPGRSALDKRRAEPEVRSISLAGGGM